MPIYGAVSSMTGGRSENQDDWGYVDTPLGFLLVVCDGMGGGPGGKTASYLVKNEIMKVLYDCNPQISRQQAVKEAVARAQEELERKTSEYPQLLGMGSTFVAILINAESAIIAHAGDSRCYRFSGRFQRYRTKDHSLVAELVAKKALTEEQARVSPQSNVITRGLGNPKNHVPDIIEVPYCKGDRFFLCTDGVWGVMPHNELVKRFRRKVDVTSLVSSMASEIDRLGFSKGGGHDNHTLAVVEISIGSRLKDRAVLKKLVIGGTIAVAAIGVVVLGLNLCSNPETETLVSSSTPMPLNLSSSYGTSSSSSEIPDAESSLPVEENPDEQNVDKMDDNDSQGKEGEKSIEGEESKDGKEGENAQDVEDVKKDTKNAVGTASKAAENIQKAMNRYDSAKSVEEKTEQDASRKLDSLRKEIGSLLNDVNTLAKEFGLTAKLDEIVNSVDVRESWFVAKEADKFKLTATARKHIDKQIERLKELKKQILKAQ